MLASRKGEKEVDPYYAEAWRGIQAIWLSAQNKSLVSSNHLSRATTLDDLQLSFTYHARQLNSTPSIASNQP